MREIARRLRVRLTRGAEGPECPGLDDRSPGSIDTSARRAILRRILLSCAAPTRSGKTGRAHCDANHERADATEHGTRPCRAPCLMQSSLHMSLRRFSNGIAALFLQFQLLYSPN